MHMQCHCVFQSLSEVSSSPLWRGGGAPTQAGAKGWMTQNFESACFWILLLANDCSCNFGRLEITDQTTSFYFSHESVASTFDIVRAWHESPPQAARNVLVYVWKVAISSANSFFLTSMDRFSSSEPSVPNKRTPNTCDLTISFLVYTAAGGLTFFSVNANWISRFNRFWKTFHITNLIHMRRSGDFGHIRNTLQYRFLSEYIALRLDLFHTTAWFWHLFACTCT